MSRSQISSQKLFPSATLPVSLGRCQVVIRQAAGLAKGHLPGPTAPEGAQKVTIRAEKAEEMRLGEGLLCARVFEGRESSRAQAESHPQLLWEVMQDVKLSCLEEICALESH